MLKFIKAKYGAMIKALVGPGGTANGTDFKAINFTASRTVPPSQMWGKEFNPLRQIILWGWDSNHNPGFLILYGRHEFAKGGNSGAAARRQRLADAVTYTGYAIFKGREGHLPAFAAVKLEDRRGYYSNRKTPPQLYYKQGLKGWSPDQELIYKDYTNLSPENQLSFDYFIQHTHEQYVEEIERRDISFDGFILAKNPAEVLKLDRQLAAYAEVLTEILSYPNLYIRRKRLNELIAANPPRAIYTLLLKIGSTELVAGLFLALAKQGRPLLLPEAQALIESELTWASGNYAKGVKRCAAIYRNAVTPELKTQRVEWIQKHLDAMDLHLVRMNGKELPAEQVLAGSTYRKYAICGVFSDYRYGYDDNGEWKRCKASARYQVGPYSDGVQLKLIDFKNTIQEAEIYGLAGVLGKIAYYLDAPRLTYYFKGSGKSKAWRYFQRYLRRVLDDYAFNQPEQFMTAMKHLLTSYTPNDYVCKFNGNFQFNFFLKHYLYHDFTETPPTGWGNWSARYDWLSQDQLLRLRGRHEMVKEVWDRHLEVVAEIAVGTTVEPIVKACYYILKDSPQAPELLNRLSYRQLIALALVGYQPLAKMFTDLLYTKVNQLTEFDPELMLALINCPEPQLHQLAMEFFRNTNGAFTPATIAELLLLDHPEQWVELFQQNLLNLGANQTVDFIRQLRERTAQFLAHRKELPEPVREILEQSVNRVEQFGNNGKRELLSELISCLQQHQQLPEWLATYLENLIFALGAELAALMAEVRLGPLQGAVSARNKRIISLLEAVQSGQMPADSQIIAILENGSAKMINTLIGFLAQNREALKARQATLLIMMESEVTALNQLAGELFDSLPPQAQRQFHAILLDSPVKRAYAFGLKKLDQLYGGQIPEAFILQMLEHGTAEVKAYISAKVDTIIGDLGAANQNLFLYYAKTLLLLPNKVSKSKDRIYEVIPGFALTYRERLQEIESLLLDIGGSNIILDSERALVTLGKIKREVMALEG